MHLPRAASLVVAVLLAIGGTALADTSMSGSMSHLSPVLVDCSPITSLYSSPTSQTTQIPITTAVFARYMNTTASTATDVGVEVVISGRPPITRHYTDPIPAKSMGSRTVQLVTPIAGDDAIGCRVISVKFADGTSYMAK